MWNAVALSLLLWGHIPANYGVDPTTPASPGVIASGPKALKHVAEGQAGPGMVVRAFVYGACLAFGASSFRRR